MKKALCPKCFRVELLQKHHITPLRFFRRNKNVLLLCRKCHREIESFIPRKRRLDIREYFDLHKSWLKSERILIGR